MQTCDTKLKICAPREANVPQLRLERVVLFLCQAVYSTATTEMGFPPGLHQGT